MSPVDLHGQVKVKFGRIDAFNEAMAAVRPLLEQRGWTMVAAWQPLIGELSTVDYVWELEDANAFAGTLADAAGDPEFLERYGAVAEHIAQERLTLAVKTSFSP